MAFTIDGLISNVTGSVQNLINTLQGKGPTPPVVYPTDSTISPVLNFNGAIQQGNWNKLPAPYSFAVIDTNISSDTNNFLAQYDPAFTAFGEFQLPLAPGKINQTEHFAIAIKSTQGGSVVSHSGNKYKTLTISGTTGVAPFRGASGVNKKDGTAIFAPDQLKYKSGFQVFMELRNYFKAYYEYKKVNRGPKSSGLRLVWKNYKDGEYLIVELLDFQMDRTAPRSFLYDYNLTFKVLAPFTFTAAKQDSLTGLESALQTATQYIDLARGTFLGAQNILRQVEATYEATILEPLRQASLALKAFQGIGTTAADVSNQAIKNTMTALAALGIVESIQNLQTQAAQGGATSQATAKILSQTTLPNDLTAATNNDPAGTVINLGNALTLLPPTAFPQSTQNIFAQEQVQLQTLPRSFFQNAYESISAIQDNATDFFNLGSAEYNAIFNRTSTITPNPSQTVTDQQYDVLNAFNLALSGLQSIISTDAFFKSTFAERIDTIVEAFDGNISLEADTATIQIILPQNTDLERLALTYLNDPNRWPEIAELNDLRLPYIIQDQSDTTSNVLHPGETILIPALPTFGFSQLPVGAEITSGPQLDALEKNLGADLKLTDDFDLSLGNDGDLQIIQSGANLGQAIALKLAYQPGELISNPTIGVGLQAGVKFPDLSAVQDNLVRSLMQDPRISTVSNIILEQNNDELMLSFEVSIKQVDTPIPLTIKVG